MLGVIMGTFSSVCLAGPLVNFLENLRAKKGAR